MKAPAAAALGVYAYKIRLFGSMLPGLRAILSG
jgi:hypothetical protein